MTLPPDIPQARFWSLTLYDNQTRSMLVTPQRYPRAGSQAYPSPAAVANPDGSTTIHVGPEQPAGVPDGNWIQTDARQGILRRPPPVQPTAAVLRQVVAASASSNPPAAGAAMTVSQTPIAPSELGSFSTPDRVESRLGTLEFNDGAPSEATAALLYDHLDFVHGVQAFLGALRGASLAAVRRGHLSKGVEDNSFLLFSELMDSTSLFLTANCDTVYFWGFIDLSDGPMVIDVPALGAPSGLLGTIDDMWFRWVTDVGLPGPDRGEGGRYLIVGPGYDGPLPDSGYHVFHARTTRVTLIGRGFMVDNDPTIPVEAIRNGVRVHPLRARRPRHRRRQLPGRTGTAGGRAPRCRRPGSSKRRGCRSTPSSRTTSATGSWSTSWCSRNHPKRATRSCSACSPRSGSSTASRSSPTPGCARSSRTPSWSATPPPAP